MKTPSIIRTAKEKAHRFFYLLYAIGLCTLFFYPVIFQGKTFFFRDIHRWFYPMKYFLAESFKAAEIPFWCPQYYCGSPFLSDIQSGVFYPLSILFLILPFPFSFNFYIVFHVFLSFCFFYLFIISLRLSRKAALLAATSYCFGGYVLATINTLNNLSTIIWLPAILWSFNSVKRIPSTKFVQPFLIFFISMAILGGEPQLLILTLVLLFFYAITSDPEEPPCKIHKRFKNCFLILMMTGIAVCITMVQLGPTYLDYQNSVRLGGISYEEASKFSIDFSTLKHLFLPINFSPGFATELQDFKKLFPGDEGIPWLLTIYQGIIVFPLTILGAVYLVSKKKILWITIFFSSILLALGSNAPFHYLFYKVLPFFRYPQKFMFVAGFSFVVMAAYGFDWLTMLLKKNQKKPLNCFFAFLILALILDLYLNHRNLNPVCNSSFYQFQTKALDPVINDLDLFRIYTNPLKGVAPVPNTILNQHFRWQTLVLPNVNILHNVDQVAGIPVLELVSQYQIEEILLRPWKQKIEFLRMANVKYIISEEELERNSELKGKIEKVNRLVYRIVDSLPRARLVGKLKQIKEGTINELIDGTFNPLYSTIGLAKAEKNQNTTPYSGKVDYIKYEKDSTIRIVARTDRPAILVLSETFYPGWKVYVNGEEKEILRLDLLFQGLKLPLGKSVIVFKFRPKNFRLFLGITIFSLFVSFLICVFFKRKRLS
jgi:hypothetical protein